MDQTIGSLMNGSPKKRSSTEIDLSKISSLKRVTDLFPNGMMIETRTQDLPKDVKRIIFETPLTKNIPNLVQYPAESIPQNSISSQVQENNQQLRKTVKSQFQYTFFKRIRPFNVVTMILALGWAITMILLYFLK